MNFDEFLKSLSKIKHIPLPAEASQFKMSPPFREELMESRKNDIKYAKQAGVLSLFYPNKNYETTLVLILRKSYKGVHSAQVAFPGGKLEPNDASLKEAAVRETFEEVGVATQTIKVVKTLSHVYIPPSNFLVQPFLAITEQTPKFVKQDDEVEAIIEVPLNQLLDEQSVRKKIVETSYSISIEVPAFKLNNHIVWGATAMMLSEIKDVLKAVL